MGLAPFGGRCKPHVQIRPWPRSHAGGAWNQGRGYSGAPRRPSQPCNADGLCNCARCMLIRAIGGRPKRRAEKCNLCSIARKRPASTDFSHVNATFIRGKPASMSRITSRRKAQGALQRIPPHQTVPRHQCRARHLAQLISPRQTATLTPTPRPPSGAAHPSRPICLPRAFCSIPHILRVACSIAPLQFDSQLTRCSGRGSKMSNYDWGKSIGTPFERSLLYFATLERSCSIPGMRTKSWTRMGPDGRFACTTGTWWDWRCSPWRRG